MEKEIKCKAIVSDLDDCIVDFIGFLCLIHNKKHRTTITRGDIVNYPMNEVEAEDIDGNVTKGITLYKTFKDLESHGLYAVLPDFPEAKQAIRMIKDELGYKIILMTARAEKFRDQTELNLLRNNIPYDELYFSKNKADDINKLKEKYDIHLFADDRASTVREVNLKCKIKYPILINRPHNERYKVLAKEIIRANDLLEVVKYLKEGKNEN